LNAADLHEGENIFRVNLSRVHDLIQQLPQTDEVQIVRKLPSEIDVRVVERKPVAWITSEKEISDPFASESAFLVDARGVLMKEKKLLPEYLGLPVILGCSSESLEVGKVVESPDAWKALELLSLSSRSFLQMRFQIREIDVSESYRLLVTDKNHSRVTFGYNDLETQLRRLEQFLVYCDDSKQELATLNLLVQRNIPVTFAPRPVAVINDTIEPAVEPRIMKAIPVHPPETGPRQGSGKQETASPPPKSRTSSKPPRRAIPIQRQRTD
jgi:cell division septal protein FtsQ